MQSKTPNIEDVQNLEITRLGEASYPSPLKNGDFFVDDDAKIMVYATADNIEKCEASENQSPQFELAGPRKNILFEGSDLVCGIVTCGGLCPGLNDVIKSIVMTLHLQYEVSRVLGFRYGYEGLSRNRKSEPLVITVETVEQIQHDGGTILGSSRGPQDVPDMVKTLQNFNIGILFVIGGDGTFSGAHALAGEIKSQNLPISIIGIPKTIDNDIYCSEVTFGFNTAVEEAQRALYSAHTEAKSVWNGVGLVMLMGRDSGFISAAATLASNDVNYCFIPEVDFSLDGEHGLLASLERRLKRKQHAVIVVAEGAGQHLFESQNEQVDASGNSKYNNIGVLLKHKIKEHFKKQNIPLTLKYIDPSYIIRSRSANAQDSSYCLMLGKHAVHAGMAGKTDMFIGYWHHHFTHVPLHVTAHRKKLVNPSGELWQTVLSVTEQDMSCRSLSS